MKLEISWIQQSALSINKSWSCCIRMNFVICGLRLHTYLLVTSKIELISFGVISHFAEVIHIMLWRKLCDLRYLELFVLEGTTAFCFSKPLVTT